MAKVFQILGELGGGIKVEAAVVGQTIKVKAIDENGKPTEWEMVDFPESTPIEVYDSLDSVPDDLPDGSFVIIPSEEEESGGSESGDSASLADLEQRVSDIERDHQDNTDFITSLTDAADNEENEGKVLGIKDGLWQPVSGAKIIDLSDEKYGNLGVDFIGGILYGDGVNALMRTGEYEAILLDECNIDEPIIIRSSANLADDGAPDMIFTCDAIVAAKNFINGDLQSITCKGSGITSGALIDYTITLTETIMVFDVTKTVLS